VYNVLSLLRRSWGEQRVVTLDPAVPLLTLNGYDLTAAGGKRGVYRWSRTAPSALDDLASRWRLQLSATYGF